MGFRLVIPIMLASMTLIALPFAAQMPTEVQVTYTDGFQRTVKNWAFTYYYGVSEHEASPPFYEQLSKRAPELLLRTGSRKEHGVTQTEVRSIPAADLGVIRYVWGEGENQHICKSVVVVLTNGEELNYDSGLRVGEKLLSSKPHVFKTSIWLTGTALVNGRKLPFSARIDKPYGGGYPEEKVAEVRFHATIGE